MSEVAPLRVVLFSGGRGSGALATTLVRTPGVSLTVAINGYDDGASTGEVRRFLGDALGPSDFRKNASRLAVELATAPSGLVRLLDRRLPVDDARVALDALMAELSATAPHDADLTMVPDAVSAALGARLSAFVEALGHRAFNFDDCSVGNLVFAGGFLLAGRRFNDAVDDYATLVGLPVGLIDNVTDGTNAHLVALDLDGHVLGREADIVDANRQNRIREIFLLPTALDEPACAALARDGADQAARSLAARSLRPQMNPRLATRLAAADLIVYAPGTQHSSLFPSYLTAGLSDAIAANARAVKLLITNIQADAEIAGSSAVDIIERAVFYLKDKGRRTTPTPALVTHYLLNAPQGTGAGDTYVPLGRLDALQDPRLVRVGQYEQSGSGRHDAAKVLGPYVAALLARRRERRRVAILLHEAGSVDKLAQTLLEMIRGGLADQPVDVTVFCETTAPLDRGFVSGLPCAVTEVAPLGEAAEDRRLRGALADGGFEYLVIFESSGMYNGEDVPWLVSHLVGGRLDAVWGSRRLSVRDIEESYRLKYRQRALMGMVSRIGSHVLSLAYLALYGRYVSDTLSGARVVRVADALPLPVGLTHKQANQYLLSSLLRRKAEMFEVPVHFYSLSPARVRRTTFADGVSAVGTIVWRRFGPAPPVDAPAAVDAPADSAPPVA
ncbi:MAG: YvcK family protein [Vicinamibacteria bacterium]|nr:YvcK family protein [Vicinamibacteria bacterium]